MRIPILNSGTPPPTLNLDFTVGFDSRITFTRASSATYFDSTGTLQTASSNVPRRDYDPTTLSPRGLLIEEQRTNDISNANSGAPAPVAPNTVSSTSDVAHLFGPASVWKHTRDTGAPGDTNCGAYVGLACSTSTVYSASLWLWVPSSFNGSNITLTLENSGTETLVTASAVNLSKRDQWQFIWTAFNSQSNTQLTPVLRITATTGNFVYTTCWQREAGIFPTSYIPTSGSAATRSADVAPMPLGPWYNQNEGTLYAEASVEAVGTTTQIVVQIDDGTSNNRVFLFDGPGGLGGNQTVGGVSNAISGPASITANTLYKAALGVNASASKLAVGGTLYGPISVAMPGGQTTLRLGTATASGFPLNGWLRRVRYWPRRLSDRQLREITR